MSHEARIGSDQEVHATIEQIKKELKENLPAKSEFLAFEPPDEWFTYGIDGFHGKNHSGRSVLFGILLAKRLKQKNPEIDINEETIALSLAWHDTQRTEETHDPYHGNRAADRLEQHSDILPQAHRDYVLKNIRLHDVPTKEIPLSEQSLELQIIKDADKIDRVRLNGDTVTNEQVLDPSRLHFKDISLEMIPIAQNLFKRTQSSKESFVSIAEAAVAMGFMKNE